MWTRALGAALLMAAQAEADEATIARLDACLETRIDGEGRWTSRERLVRLSGCASEIGALETCAAYDLAPICLRREGGKLDALHEDALAAAEGLTEDRKMAWGLYMLDRNRDNFLTRCAAQFVDVDVKASRAEAACVLMRKSAEIAIVRGLWIAEGRP